jgi:hypothetical protein
LQYDPAAEAERIRFEYLRQQRVAQRNAQILAKKQRSVRLQAQFAAIEQASQEEEVVSEQKRLVERTKAFDDKLRKQLVDSARENALQLEIRARRTKAIKRTQKYDINLKKQRNDAVRALRAEYEQKLKDAADIEATIQAEEIKNEALKADREMEVAYEGVDLMYPDEAEIIQADRATLTSGQPYIERISFRLEADMAAQNPANYPEIWAVKMMKRMKLVTVGRGASEQEFEDFIERRCFKESKDKTTKQFADGMSSILKYFTEFARFFTLSRGGGSLPAIWLYLLRVNTKRPTDPIAAFAIVSDAWLAASDRYMVPMKAHAGLTRVLHSGSLSGEVVPRSMESLQGLRPGLRELFLICAQSGPNQPVLNLGGSVGRVLLDVVFADLKRRGGSPGVVAEVGGLEPGTLIRRFYEPAGMTQAFLNVKTKKKNKEVSVEWKNEYRNPGVFVWRPTNRVPSHGVLPPLPIFSEEQVLQAIGNRVSPPRLNTGIASRSRQVSPRKQNAPIPRAVTRSTGAKSTRGKSKKKPK